MTPAEHKTLLQRAGGALVAATCLALLVHVFDARIERQEVRAERAEAAAKIAEQRLMRARPTSDFFEYTSVEPVVQVVQLGMPFAMQSTSTFHALGDVYHDDRLRCWPVGADGELGRGRLLPRALDVVRIGEPRVNGVEMPSPMPEGYKYSSGEWTFGGELPRVESDCLMISHPCMKPMEGIEKCQTITSGFIKFRELSLLAGFAAWRQRKAPILTANARAGAK